jgi:hypothetical protein
MSKSEIRMTNDECVVPPAPQRCRRKTSTPSQSPPATLWGGVGGGAESAKRVDSRSVALPTCERLLCRELHDHRAWLWMFLYHDGVEPTNNAGERALRHAVIWRKLSFGAQSAAGSQFVETMLTVIETCR